MAGNNRLKFIGIGVSALLVLLVLAMAAWWLMPATGPRSSTEAIQFQGGVGPAATPQPPAGPPAPNDIGFQTVPVNDPALAAFPYAHGWPLALPGEIIGTPVVADLLGDGKLEVVVPCTMRNEDLPHVHPSPNPMPLLFAIRPDGTTLPGWPVTLGDEQPKGDAWGGWASSPSVFRRDGKDQLVLIAGVHGGVKLVRGDRSAKHLGGGNPCINVPLADLDGDGVIDVVTGGMIGNVDSKPINDWPSNKKFKNGFCPSIGDALGDGKLELYHLFYTPHDSPYPELGGFDSHGNVLPGWPRKIEDASWLPPVMGDIDGDGKMEVVATYGQRLFAWHADGSAMPNTTTDGPMTGILKSGIAAVTSCPALADVDGDGKADIVIFDGETHTLRAWHADGSSAFTKSTVNGEPANASINAASPRAGNINSLRAIQQAILNYNANNHAAAAQAIPAEPVPPTVSTDGIVAALPNASAGGVSVVSLGDDPAVIDFFTGTYWVRHFPDGHVTITNMLPADASIEWTQPTVCDLDGDGQADILFGLTDGRLFVYQTHLAYHADRMQWPTANGNFQHTGCWRRATPATQPAVEKK